MEQYIDILKFLLSKGVTVTLQITVVAYAISLVVGLLIGLARTANIRFCGEAPEFMWSLSERFRCSFN
jgi:ABC-type amino acid transport system permease subunit